jgi:hypothetical protein
MRRLGRQILGVFLATLLVILPVWPKNAQAQTTDPSAINLTTSPLPINLITNPGTTVSTDLRIKNSGTADEHLKVGLLKFGANDTSGQPKLLDREPGDDYFDWVSFSENNFVAEPNVWKTIKMTIKVPQSAALGYYYAVTFSRANGAAEQEQGAGLNGGAAILVLLEARVAGARRSVKFADFTVGHRIFEFLPADFTITLRNDGNIHLIPTGTIYVTKGDEQIALLDVNAARGNILPNSTRVFTAAWEDGFPQYVDVVQDGKIQKNKDGTNKKTLKWDLSKMGKLRFGRYTATALLVYDDGQKDVPLEAVVSFWVIPWRIIGIGLLIVAIVLAGLWFFVRNIWRAGKHISNKATGKSGPGDGRAPKK